jgi:hypothetical protein
VSPLSGRNRSRPTFCFEREEALAGHALPEDARVTMAEAHASLAGNERPCLLLSLLFSQSMVRPVCK